MGMQQVGTRQVAGGAWQDRDMKLPPGSQEDRCFAIRKPGTWQKFCVPIVTKSVTVTVYDSGLSCYFYNYQLQPCVHVTERKTVHWRSSKGCQQSADRDRQASSRCEK